LGFMICSYSDESADQNPGVYSVCSLMGKLMNFVELERRWRAALDDEGIPEFHAAKLENHLPPYDDTSFDFDRRSHLQRRFIDIITGQEIWGYNSFVEIAALAKYKDRMRPFFDESGLKPYTFGFRMAVEVLAIEVDDYRRRDPIAFVFDQQKEHEGHAREIYDYLSTDGQWPLSYRLGSISFQSRLVYVALQAADVWAYESRKNVADSIYLKQPDRWQVQLFKDAGRFNIQGFREGELLRQIDGWERGDNGRPESTGQVLRRRALSCDTLGSPDGGDLGSS
jgi:hypothetical protein